MASDLCKSYLAALEAADLSAVRAMFTPDGIVSSPLYGEMPAQDFYAELFSVTSRSETTLLNIFDSSENGTSTALNFRYVWTLGNGKVVTFECVDVFELSEDRKAFKKLTIIYDTAPLRADFESVRSA